MKPLEKEDLQHLLQEAIWKDEILRKRDIRIEEWEALLRLSGGDARKLLNTFELVVNAVPGPQVTVTDELVLEHVQQNMALYDKTGEQHYDIISAFIKSIRGSDPNGALYWLARMIEGGEDPLFIARRLVILAAEDIGLANPTALVMANNCFQALNVIGMPEGRIILSHTTVYLATSPKSNSAYAAIDKALGLVRQSGDLPVPLHLRNAPTRLMKELGYGKDYRYSHGFEGNFSEQEYLPEGLGGTTLFEPGENAREKDLRNWLNKRWKGKYGY